MSMADWESDQISTTWSGRLLASQIMAMQVHKIPRTSTSVLSMFGLRGSTQQLSPHLAARNPRSQLPLGCRCAR
eukprot:6321857-Pyramimonas_sp.AAC.2